MKLTHGMPRFPTPKPLTLSPVRPRLRSAGRDFFVPVHDGLCAVAKLPRHRALGPELHSGKCNPDLARADSLPRLSVSLRAAHLPVTGHHHQALRTRGAATLSLCLALRRVGYAGYVAHTAPPSVRSALPARLTAFLLAVPLIFLGTNSIFPHPFYDSDCTLILLFCIWLLLHLERRDFPVLATVLCGVCFAIPLFIKQNTGLAFPLSAAACIVFFGIRERRVAILLLAGFASGVIIGLGLIQCTAGAGNYLHWTIQFASSRRLPGVGTVLGVYRDPGLMWIFAVFAGGLALLLLHPIGLGLRQRLIGWLTALLLALPFLWAFAALFF